jgi:hypothetical protein
MRAAQYRRNSIYGYGRITQHYTTHILQSAWTKGFIVNGADDTMPTYEVKRIVGQDYMFIECASPQGHYVFKKTNAAFNNKSELHFNNVKAEYDLFSPFPAEARETVTGLNIPIRIMWLIYTNGVLDGKTYAMSGGYRQMVFDVMGQFKEGIEKATGNNVEIINDYTVIHRELDISENRPDVGSSFISNALVQTDIDQFAPASSFHFVFTVSAIDTRPIRGVSSGSLWFEQGYANCYFVEGDPHNASVAVHEFIHALEIDFHPGIFPGIEIPLRHALFENYPGYEAYATDGEYNEAASQFDDEYFMRVFERDFFKADIRFTEPHTGAIKYVGIFPSMWQYFYNMRN